MIIDHGFAFSQEAGQAPQITESLINKIRIGLSNKYSFVPKVTSRTDSYNPNMESINQMLEGEGDPSTLLKGSFNPEYVHHRNSIKDNYFRGQQELLSQEDNNTSFQAGED